MSRPTPQVLQRQRLGRTDTEIVIQKGDGYWVIVYQDQPITILRNTYYIDRKKYARTGFAHEGHAKNLCTKLNRQFGTELFTVRKLI